jgi:hypothetical protein
MVARSSSGNEPIDTRITVVKQLLQRLEEAKSAEAYDERDYGQAGSRSAS